MALSLLRRHYASSSRPLLFIKSRFLTSKAFLFSEEPRSGLGSNIINGPPLLEVKDLKAVVAESNQEILKGVNLLVRPGEIHSIVGHDGSGKSTLMKVLLGDPAYRVTGGSILYKGKNLLELDPQDRSPTGGFISFNTVDFMDIPSRFPNTPYFNGSSNAYVVPRPKDYVGERKRRNDIRLLAVLGGELGILDEIYFRGDEMVGIIAAVNELLAPKYPRLMVNYYHRIFKFANMTSPHHVMEDGIILPDFKGCWHDLLEPKEWKIPKPRLKSIPSYNNPPPLPPSAYDIDMLKSNSYYNPPPLPPSYYTMAR